MEVYVIYRHAHFDAQSSLVGLLQHFGIHICLSCVCALAKLCPNSLPLPSSAIQIQLNGA